jgi:hypothetical protein
MHDKLTMLQLNQLAKIAYEEGQNPVASHLRTEASLQIIENINKLDTSSLNLDQFTEKVANLIRDEFGLYFVGLYLLDLEGQRAILFAGSGEIGQALRKRLNPILPKHTDVPVAAAISFNKAQLIDNNVMLAKPYLTNPYLPDTRLEMAIPLRVHGNVIGALKICSCVPDSLNEEDIEIFMPIAEKIGSICADLIKAEYGN